MDTLFLFTTHLNQDGCFCLRRAPNGTLNALPAQRDFAEIQKLQKDCNTLIIETSVHASLLSLEFPWIPERKARAAIPYALEEKLAQPVHELHFAFDRALYQNNRYLVAIISNQRIRFIMDLLKEKNIEFTSITLDWFALEPEELCLTESTLLVNTPDFKGALTGDLAEAYLKNHITHKPLLFEDSKTNFIPTDWTKDQGTSYAWIAQRILKSRVINLCQGEMQHDHKPDLTKKGYQIVIGLGLLWLISIIGVNAINLYFLNKQTQNIDKQIAVIYREFFPDAKQIISPKFRIEQLLKSNNRDEQNRFWYLLNQFSALTPSGQFTLEQLHYQNKTLSLTLVSPDFAHLEHLEKELKKVPIHVRQTQASMREQQVVATLELT
jgi:general secretion pathway protein L